MDSHSEVDLPQKRMIVGHPRRSTVLAFGVLIALILASRWPSLGQQLVERHGFRQTQTAFQSLTLSRGEGSLLRPILPIFGAPWEVPFEFPFFQFVASLAIKIFGLSPDLANRSTSLAFFVLCLLPLWLIARRQLSIAASALTVLLFSFSPFSLQWSRASLIEYCAVFFGLLFVFLSTKSFSRASYRSSGGAALAGALCGAVKATTLVAMLAFLSILVLADVAGTPLKLWVQKHLRMTLLPCFISVLGAQIWTAHADAIKSSAEPTAWLAGENMNEWNFGTLAQRLEWSNWVEIYSRIDQLFMGKFLLPLVVVLALVGARRRPLLISSIAGIVVPIAIFFNLYKVHDYYLAAISPFVALLGGVALDGVLNLLRVQHKNLRTLAGSVLFVVLLGWPVTEESSYWKVAYADFPGVFSELATVSAPKQHAFVSFGGWDSSLLYYADRRGMMLDPRAASLEYLREMSDLDTYDFYAGDGNRIDVMMLRGWWSPTGLQTVRIDDNLDDLRSLKIALGNATPHEELRDTDVESAVLTCDGVSPFPLKSVDGVEEIRTQPSGDIRLVLSATQMPVPVGQLMHIFDRSEVSDIELRCIGNGTLRFEWTKDR